MWTYAHAMLSRRVVTPLDLGFDVRDARMAVGLTQAELVEKAGVSREWLNGVERGKRPRVRRSGSSSMSSWRWTFRS